MKTAAPKERRSSASAAKDRKPRSDGAPGDRSRGDRSRGGELRSAEATASLDRDLDDDRLEGSEFAGGGAAGASVVGREFAGGGLAGGEAPGGEFGDLGQAWDRATSGAGHRLPQCDVLEEALGRDLGHVRLYRSPRATSLLDRLGAQAATRGSQVLIRDAVPDAQTLIHEVVHTLQSRTAGPPQVQVAGASSAAEREAEQVAEQLPSLLQAGALPSIQHRLVPGSVALRRESAESRVRSLVDYLTSRGAQRDEEADPSLARSEESEESDEVELPDAASSREAETADEAEAPETEIPEAEIPEAEEPTIAETEAEGLEGLEGAPDADAAEAAGGPARRRGGGGGGGAVRPDGAAESTTEEPQTTVEPAATSEPALARGACIINPRQQYQLFLDNAQAAWDRGASDLDGVSALPCECSATQAEHRPYAGGPQARAPPGADESLPAEPTDTPEIDPETDPALARARSDLGSAVAPDGSTASTVADPDAERAGARVQQEVRRDVQGELEDAPEVPEIETELEFAPEHDPARLPGEFAAYQSNLNLRKAEARAQAEVDPGARRLAPSRDPTEDHDYALSGVAVPAVETSSRVPSELLARIPNDDNVGTVPLDQLSLVQTGELEAGQAALDREGQVDPAVQQEIDAAREQTQEACCDASRERDSEVAQAAGELEGHQEGWEADIDAHEGSERATADRAHREGSRRAERIQRGAETSARDTVHRADTEAGRRWSEARRETDRRIGESSDEGLFTRAVRFFRDVVNTLRRLVLAFLEGVRRAVRALFDAARAAVRALIERARQSIQNVLDWVSQTLRVLADNLPGVLGRIADHWQTRIARTLQTLQTQLDSWANGLSNLIDSGLAALANLVDSGISNLEEGVNAAADAVNELLSEGLLAFIRQHFPALVTLIEQGLLAPIQQATAALDDWIERLLEGSGILRLQQALETTQQTHTCEIASEEQVTDLCEGFEMLLQQALDQFDELLESPAAQELRASIDEANQAVLEERAGTLSRLFTFAQEAAGEVLEWWNTIESGIRELFSLVGNFACAIWRHIAAALGLPPDLDPITALRQALEALWLDAIERVRPMIDRALALWREIRNSEFVQALIAVRDGVRDAMVSVRRLWNEVVTAGEAWLVSIAERFRTELVDPVVRFLGQVGDTLRTCVDALEAFADRLVQRFDEFMALIGQLLGLDSLIRLLQALLSPLRALVRLVFACLLRGLRALAWAVSNLGQVARRVLDLLVGLALAFVATPLSIAAFLLGNVWTYLVPECMKGPVIDFLLRVLIRVIEFFPVPNDVALLIVYQGIRGFLRGLLSAPTEQKVAAANFVARIFGGDAMVGAGLLVGLLRAVWDSTVGLVLMAIQVVVWLIAMPFRALGITGGDDEEEGEEAAAAAPPEETDLAEDEAVQFGGPIEDDAAPTSDEPESEEATADSEADSEGIDLTQPPELPPEVAQIRENLQAFVDARMTQEELQAILVSLRDRLAATIYDHAKSLGLRALGALDADAMGYRLGFIVGYIYGLVLVMVVMALLTAWAGGAGAGVGVGAGTAGAGGEALAALGQGSSWLGRGASALRGAAGAARGVGGFARILTQVRRFVQPLLNVVGRLRSTRLGPLIARLEVWFQRMFRWLRVYALRLQRTGRRVLREARRIWDGLPDWMRNAATTWAQFRVLALQHQMRTWGLLSAEMNDEMLSETSLRARLLGFRTVARRSLPRGVTLQFRAEREPDQEHWRLLCRVRHALFAGGVQWQSRLVYASDRSNWAWYATDQDGDSWYSTDDSQRDENARAADRLVSLIQSALAAELELDPNQDFETLHDNLYDDSGSIEGEASRGLLTNVGLTFDEHHYETRVIRDIVHFVYPYVISPNTSVGEKTVSTGKPPRRALPETRITYEPLTPTAEFGTGMTAKPLTRRGAAGGPPSIRGPVWDQLNFRRRGGGSFYVRGHLLNHNIHGPGNTWDNLAPITRSANAQHSRDVEETMKRLVAPGREAFEYTVHVDYRSGGPNTGLLGLIDQDISVGDEMRATRRRVVTAEQYLPTQLLCSAWYLDASGGRDENLDPIFDNYPIPNRPVCLAPSDYQVSNGVPRDLLHLNLQNPYPPGSTSDATALDAYQQLDGVGPITAAYLLAHRSEFRQWRDLYAVPRLSAETVQSWRNEDFTVQVRGGVTRWDPPH